MAGEGFPWLQVGVGAAAALAAILWWIFGDDENGPRRRAAAPEPMVDQDEPPAMTAAPAPVVDAVDDRRADATGALERNLGEDQLWATVRGDGDAVVVQSAFCADPGLAARVDAAVVELRAAGFRSLRCVEQHGSIAFERAF